MGHGREPGEEWLTSAKRGTGRLILKPEPLSAEQFKGVRYVLGFTQQDMALTLGVHISTIARWESKEQIIPPHIRLALRWVVRERSGQDPTF